MKSIKKVLSKIGEGDHGVVYEIDTGNGLRAVKRLRSSPPELAQIVTGFSRLQHPNLVSVVPGNTGKTDIEMERVDGFSLANLLYHRGALPQEISVAIGIMICRALVYAYQHSIVHLNLKPSNVLIHKSGLVQICDFNKLFLPLKNPDQILQLSIGRYCAPEVLSGQYAEPASDLYSLGCLMYEMISGRRVFSQQDDRRLRSARKANRIISLKRYKTKINAKLDQLIGQCLRRTLKRRPQSAKVVLEKLELIYNEISDFPPQEAVEYFVNATQGITVVPGSFPLRSVLAIVASVVIAAFFMRPPAKESTQESLTRILFFRDTTAASAESDSIEEITVDSVTVEFREEILPVEAAVKDTPVPKPLSSPPREFFSKPEKTLESSNENKDVKPEYTPDKSKQVLDDLLAAMATMVGSGNYTGALDTYDMLSGEEQESTKGLLLKMRALEGTDNTAELSKFFTQYNVADKEFHCLRGRFLFSRKNYQNAIEALQMCRELPASLSDPDYLDRTSLYYIASAYTRLYHINPSEELRKTALESWLDVKYSFRSNQNHSFYKTIENEIRHLLTEKK